MAKLLIFVSMFVFASASNAQCFYAKYKVTTEPTMLSGILPVSLHIIYNVWADSNFIEIIGTDDSIVSDIPANFEELKKNSKDEHIVIERRTGIGFFVKDNKYVYVKKAKVLSKTKAGDCFTIQTYEKSQIRVCKNIRSMMTPGILFDLPEVPYGVEWFKSKNSTIKLASKISTSDRTLNYQNLFDKIDVSKITDTVDFYKD